MALFLSVRFVSLEIYLVSKGIVIWERIGNIYEVCGIQVENLVKCQHLPLAVGINDSRDEDCS